MSDQQLRDQRAQVIDRTRRQRLNIQAEAQRLADARNAAQNTRRAA